MGCHQSLARARRLPIKRSTTSPSTTGLPSAVPVLQGLWFRARAAILDQQDAKTLGYQFRITINWEQGLI